MKYYPINETLARRAKSMNSFSDYVDGSATAAYRAEVDKAAELAEQQKQRVDPIHHERINYLLDTYARRLAENTNKLNEIAARVPSVLIAGPANFPVRKKQKQNRAEEAAMEEWKQIQGILDKIRGTGKGGISADDPEAVAKLKEKVEGLEQFQEKMKAVNAYYRKNKTLDDCPLLTPDEVEKLKADMGRSWRADPKPYESFMLTNNNAAIRQAKTRIKELSEKAETEYEGWVFDGGTVKMDREANRLQVFFDEKPDRDTCSAMRHGGFRWAPSVGAWQRQLNNNAVYTAKHMDCLRPLAVEQPMQKVAAFHIREHGQERWLLQKEGTEFLDAAVLLREYRIVYGSAFFADTLANAESITPDRFDQLVSERLENTGRVAGAFDIDLDKGEFSALNIMDGWKTYRVEDVTTATFHAVMKRLYPESEQWDMFLNHLEGRELTADDPGPVEQPTPTPEQTEAVQEAPPETGSGWGFCIVPDLKTWADDAENQTPLEYFPSFEAAKARFEELRGEGYNSEVVEPGPDGQPPARLTLGLEAMGEAVDILHVRQGENYLVDDFVRMERLRDDPAVMDILSRVSHEIGFDYVRVHGMVDGQMRIWPKVPFAEWPNPYFAAATPGSIAAKYQNIIQAYFSLPENENYRSGQISEVVQYLQKEGKGGADQLAQIVADFTAGLPDDPAVHNLASMLMKELAQYNEPGQNSVRRHKPPRKKSQER